MYRITCISDSHTKHDHLIDNLPGGDILIHAGDLSSTGRPHEIESFCKWFDKIDNYDDKIFIAGNHDFLFENHPAQAAQIVNSYKWITYLQDTAYSLGPVLGRMIKIYGSPWQPEFYNWAFNLPHNEIELEKNWAAIPEDTDILITHGPPHGTLDKVIGQFENLGCQKLTERLKVLKPKIHIFGHIHSGRGYYFDGTTHYFNASVLDERYDYQYQPMTFDWDPNTNEIKIISN